MKKDQKGDLVEQLIFEAYKDKDVRSAVYFKDLIKRNYGYRVTSDLYSKIINYQVKKYGTALQNLTNREYVRHFGLKGTRSRHIIKEIAQRRVQTERYVERVENEKNKRTVKGKKS